MRYNERRIYLERLRAERADLLRQLDEIEQQIRLTTLENTEIDEVDPDSEDFSSQWGNRIRVVDIPDSSVDPDFEDVILQPECVSRRERNRIRVVDIPDSPVDPDFEDVILQPEYVSRRERNRIRVVDTPDSPVDSDFEDVILEPEYVSRREKPRHGAPVNITGISKQTRSISKSGSGIGGVMATLFLILLAVAFCAA